MKNKSNKFLLLLSSMLLGGSAGATEKITCQESSHYTVVEKSIEGDQGSDFLVKYKSKQNPVSPCRYIVKKSDLEIKNEVAASFIKLQDDFLFLDEGGSPLPTRLIIWNLKNRKKVYTGKFSEPYEIKSDSMEFWMPHGVANPENCPEFEKWHKLKLEAEIEAKVVLRFSDFTIQKSSMTRCSPRE